MQADFPLPTFPTSLNFSNKLGQQVQPFQTHSNVLTSSQLDLKVNLTSPFPSPQTLKSLTYNSIFVIALVYFY